MTIFATFAAWFDFNIFGCMHNVK